MFSSSYSYAAQSLPDDLAASVWLARSLIAGAT
jgi:hypothetical protein